MHVVYRMRGLLGEATEDIVERLDTDKSDQNDEDVYKLASVLSECGGIEVGLGFACHTQRKLLPLLNYRYII